MKLTDRRPKIATAENKAGVKEVRNHACGKVKRPFLHAIIAVAAAGFLTSTALQAAGMDDPIEFSARNAYVFRTHLKHDAIQITSSKGTVTLTGSVCDSWHGSLAEDTVQSLPRVKSVSNQLTVREKNLVETTSGVVTISGVAQNEDQKTLLTRIVADIDGVMDAINRMTLPEAALNRPIRPAAPQNLRIAAK